MHPATTTQTRTPAEEALPLGRRGARRRVRGAPGGDPGAGRRDRQERPRPARGDVDQAALCLIARRGAEIVATARRYAATPEDAEDAYQRGLEILLRKAPTTREEELVPWLKTVVKHEAFALRRQRVRHTPVTDDGELVERATPEAITHDRAAQYERLRQGAEALGQLKQQEIRALVLRAEGYSYREICQITAWTYTKVNRCLTEGRHALAIKLAGIEGGIEGGIECATLAPLLAALVDGRARPDELAPLGRHMRSCLACRARLKSLRTYRQQRAPGGPANGVRRTSLRRARSAA